MNKPDVFYKHVGQSIRARRKELGLSQEALAKAIGLKRPSMSNIEKGRQNILLHTFCDIVESLSSNPTDLLPQAPLATPVQMPDLTALSDEARKFVEAGIKPALKEEHNGDPKTQD